MQKIFVIVLFFITTLALKAQDTSSNKSRVPRQDRKAEKRERINALLKLEEEGDPAFRKHSIFGFKAASDGYGLSYEIGKYKSPKRTLLFQFELNEKKHPKEQKVVATQNIFGQVNSVVFGKVNNFYQFKLGIGQQHLIGGKANKNGVAVSYLYGAGFSLGMAKPYYIDISNGVENKKVTFPALLSDSSLGNYIIIGSSGFTYGWNHLGIKPGVHAKAAMRFDYGRFNEMVTAIEAGLNTEYYFNAVEQVMYNNPKNFFFNAYIAIEFGRRK